MARNEEKHSGRLNRLWLQQLDEDQAKKNPQRPGLGSLHTAQGVKKWMPSIKKDIDFYLKQSQVGCYPDRKIAEFSEKIDSLTREYKAYLRKYRELEGGCTGTPWTDAPYSRKHERTEETPPGTDLEPSEKVRKRLSSTKNSETSSFAPLALPILDLEDSYKDQYGYDIVNKELPRVPEMDGTSYDFPVEFKRNKDKRDEAQETNAKVQNDYFHSGLQDEPLDFDKDRIARRTLECSSNCDRTYESYSEVSKCDSCQSVNVISDDRTHNIINGEQVQGICEKHGTGVNIENTKKSGNFNDNATNILNLPYSDSSSEEDT